MPRNILIYGVLIFFLIVEILWIWRARNRRQLINQLLLPHIGILIVIIGLIVDYLYLTTLGVLTVIVLVLIQSLSRFPFRYQKALNCFFKGDMKSALQYVNELIQVSPNSSHAYLLRVLIYLALGEVAKAKQDTYKIKQLKSASPDEFVALGQVSYFQGQYSEAKEAFMQALELQPGLEPHLISTLYI